MERYFQISFHALVLSAFIAIGRTGQLDLVSALLFAICFFSSAHRALRRRPALLSPPTAFWLSLGYVVFFPIDLLALSGSFVSAVIHLILFLVVIKLAQEKQDKDYFYLILLSFLQILAASSLTIDMSFVLTLLLFLAALVSTLMSFEIHRSQRAAPGSSDVRISGPLGSMSIWATVWIVILGVGVFFVVPRFGTGYFTRASTESLLLSGFSGTVELGEIGQVKLSSALVMRTRLLGGTLLAAPRWRGVALDTFDGRRWYAPGMNRTRVPTIGEELHVVQPPGPVENRIEFEVFLEPLATPALFGPHVLGSVTGTFPALERDENDSVFMRSPSSRRIRYEVSSTVPSRLLSLSTEEPAVADDTELLRFLQLPDDLDPRIRELARTATSGGRTTLEKASLLELHLKRNYAYTLTLDWNPGDQPLSTFLFDSKRGHCEYFASSMAIMLRAVGIPTRVVNGFLPGEFNAVSGAYIIRQSDAHSWIEVFVPGQGWVEFDPTPPDRGSEFNMGRLLAHYMDAFELFWNSYILTYDSGTQLQLFRRSQDTMTRFSEAVQSGFDRTVSGVEGASDRFFLELEKTLQTVWFWSVVLTAMLTRLAVAHRDRLRVYWKFLRLRTGLGQPDPDVVAELFQRAARLAAPGAGTRRPHETWREWAHELPDGSPHTLINRALEVFEKARYGEIPITREEISLLETTVAELKSAGARSRTGIFPP